MKYRVMYKSTKLVYLDVDADSVEKAKEIADNMDSGEFCEDGTEEWEFDRVEDEDGNILE
jgi:hypothetical protein